MRLNLRTARCLFSVNSEDVKSATSAVAGVLGLDCRTIRRDVLGHSKDSHSLARCVTVSAKAMATKK
jgi:hypothetical protein